jgi:hypothetical protein
MTEKCSFIGRIVAWREDTIFGLKVSRIRLLKLEMPAFRWQKMESKGEWEGCGKAVPDSPFVTPIQTRTRAFVR